VKPSHFIIPIKVYKDKAMHVRVEDLLFTAFERGKWLLSRIATDTALILSDPTATAVQSDPSTSSNAYQVLQTSTPVAPPTAMSAAWAKFRKPASLFPFLRLLPISAELIFTSDGSIVLWFRTLQVLEGDRIKNLRSSEVAFTVYKQWVEEYCAQEQVMLSKEEQADTLTKTFCLLLMRKFVRGLVSRLLNAKKLGDTQLEVKIERYTPQKLRGGTEAARTNPSVSYVALSSEDESEAKEVAERKSGEDDSD
jgi:hypothetical protein